MGQLVEALRFKSEGCGLDSWWCNLDFYLLNPSGRTMALGSNKPLTDISARNISWRVKTAGVYGWQLYDLQMPAVLKSGSLKLLEPSEPLQLDLLLHNGIVNKYYIMSQYFACWQLPEQCSSFCLFCVELNYIMILKVNLYCDGKFVLLHDNLQNLT